MFTLRLLRFPVGCLSIYSSPGPLEKERGLRSDHSRSWKSPKSGSVDTSEYELGHFSLRPHPLTRKFDPNPIINDLHSTSQSNDGMQDHIAPLRQWLPGLHNPPRRKMKASVCEHGLSFPVHLAGVAMAHGRVGSPGLLGGVLLPEVRSMRCCQGVPVFDGIAAQVSIVTAGLGFAPDACGVERSSRGWPESS